MKKIYGVSNDGVRDGVLCAQAEGTSRKSRIHDRENKKSNHNSMKSIYSFIFVMLLAAFVFTGNAEAQTITNYAFTSSVGTYNALSGGTSPTFTGSTDEGYTAQIPIGFTFIYMGVPYTTFSASTNGFIVLGQTLTSATLTNNLSTGTPRPFIAPLWDDNNLQAFTNFTYQVSGSAPNRVFTCEWLNEKWNYNATSNVISFQVKLYESGGKIDFVYRDEGGTVNSGSASIGITGTVTGSGSFLSLSSVAVPAVSSTTETTTLATKPATGTTYTFTPPVTTPNAPSNLSFSGISGTSYTLNWTDNSSNETGFGIWKSTDGINYNYIGNVAANTTTYNATGLNLGTNYYWQVAALNEGSISSYISGSQATNSPTLSGTKYVGTGANPMDYATLTAAFTDINNNGLAGNLNLVLNTTYTTTDASFPIAGPSATAVGSYTVTIYPSVTGLSITSASSTGTLNLNGSKNIVIDGRVGASGSTKDLTISNTSTSGYVIQFINDAVYNTIKYSIIKGVNSGTTSGNIVFSTTTGTTGNDNNTIDNCDIRDGATTPTNIIYSAGTTTTTATNNSNNTISNNNIFNFYNSTSTSNAGVGVNISSGTTDWTISGNSFYQTSTRTTFGAAATMNAVLISNSSGNNFSITGNYVGGTGAQCSGTPLTLNAATTLVFRAIQLTVGTTTATSIQGNTFQNISVTTTSASTAQSLISLVTGSFNCGNITGNTLGSQSSTGNITFSTSGSAAIYTAILAGTGTPGTINISNNTIGGITVSNSGSPVTGISTRGIGVQGAATSYTISNNTIGSPSVANSFTSSANSSIIGIFTTSTSTTNTISGNTISNMTQTGTGTSSQVFGILEQGSSGGAFTTTGNTINALSSTAPNLGTLSSSSVVGFSHTASTTAGQTISQNKIYDIKNTNTTAAVNVLGMYYNGPTSGTNTVSRNFIHTLNLSTSSTSSSIIGLYVAGGLTNYQNNMIRLGIDATGSSITTAYGINGISDGVGTNNYYFNSVYLGGTGVTTGTSSTFCFNSTITTNTRAFQNNIFYNARSNGTGTGKHYSVKVGGTTPNPTGLTINYNDYLANGTGGVFGFFNSADVASLAAWKTAVGQDANSLNSDPQFIAPNGTSSTVDLHISATNPTPIEAAGLLIGSVTDDYDGQTRSGLTPTDIGADAGNFVGNDLTPPTISYTVLGNSTSTTTVSFTNVTITDASGVNTTSGTKPRVYYKKSTNANTYNDNTSGTDGWKYAEANGSSSPFDFTINYSLLSGGTASAGDIIQYFVVAQDIASTPNVAINNGSFALTPSSVALTAAAFPIGGTPNSYTILGTISGTIHVGTSQSAPYNTLTNAIADYNAKVQTGPVIFLLDDATYSASETFPISINQNSGSNATNTLTIKPNSGQTTSISGSNTSALIKLNGADYVTIDGSNNGTTSKNLSFTNTATSGAVIWYASQGTGSGCIYNTIKNCTINGGSYASGNYGISVGGTTIGTTGDDNDYLTIQNNTITKEYYGIYLAASSAGTDDGLSITGNLIGSNTATDYVQFRGIYITGAPSASISQNEVFNIQTTGSLNNAAIEVLDNSSNTTISRNKIYGLRSTSTSGYGSYGINIAPTTGATGVTISNNIIYDIITSNYSTTSTTWNAFGIRIAGGTGHKIYYNSVNLFGAVSGGTAAGMSAAFLVTASTITGLDVRNNIFANSTGFTVSGAKSYTAYVVASTVFSNINYNDYYASGTYGVLGYYGADQTTIAAWRTASSQDVNSVSGDPKFGSNTDLHINTTATTPVNNAGTPIAAVTVDYDGDSRNATTPDIGADEYTYIAPSVVDPSNLAATCPFSTQLNLTWTNNPNNDIVMLVYNTTNTFGKPVDGQNYSPGNPLDGGGTILFVGPDQFYNHSGLNYSTTYYYKAFSQDQSLLYSLGTTLTATTTLPAVPVSITATASGSTQLDLSWTKNASNSNVLVAWNTTNTFGTPVNGTTYTTGNTITGGGTVLYNGANLTTSHTGLSAGTTYYYKIWSVDDGIGFSTTGVTTNGTTFLGIPYAQDFNAGTTLPTGWGGTMSVSASHGASSTNGLYYNLYSSATTCNATTPRMGPATSTTELSFDYRIVNFSGYPATGTTLGASDNIQIQVSTNGGTNYTTAYTINQSNHVTSTSFANKVVSLSSYSGNNINIKILGTWGSGDYYIDFDNINVYNASGMTYSSSTTTQSNTNPLGVGMTNQQIIGIQVVTTGTISPLSITDFNLNTNGCTNAPIDIANAKLFYTGSSSTFATTTQFGSTYNSPNGAFTISGSQTLSQGTNYFWLTYDISGSATPSDVVDAECNQITISSSNYIPSTQAPSGNRTIVGPMSGTFTVGLAAFNKASGKNLYVQYEKVNSSEISKKEVKKYTSGTELDGKQNIQDRSKISEMLISAFNGNTELSKENKEKEITIGVIYENGKPYNGPLFVYNNFSVSGNFSDRETEKNDKNVMKSANLTKGTDVKGNSGISKTTGQTDQPNGIYGTLTAAINDLNNRGVSGAVTFSLVDGTYPSETYPIVINAVSGANATNTITIKPAAGITPVISSSTTNGALIKLNGADYVTIDGSNNGTNSRDLTITNTNTGASTCGVWIGSASASDGATYNTIKNVNFTGSSSTTTICGIFIGSGVTFGNAAESQNNDNTIQNNTFSSFQNGIYHNGNASNDANLVISGNTIGSSVVANKLGFRGLIVQNVSSPIISGNNILGVVSSTTSSSTMTGIQVGGTVSGGTISKNVIRDIKQVNTTGWGSNGIFLNSSSTAANLTVCNNIIYDVASYGYSAASSSDNGYGIMVNGGGGYNIYYNSINLATNQTSTTGIPACINVYSGVTTANSVDIRNNILANNETIGTYCYAIYSSAAATVFSSINYNDYYTPAASGRMGYIGSTTYSTLASWVTANNSYGFDKYSFSGNPGFTSATDLTPNTSSANSWVLSGNGTHLAGVTDDFNGTARPSSIVNGAPDIGAYELGVPSVDPNTTTITVAGVGTTNLTVNGRVMGSLYFSNVGSPAVTSVDVKFFTGSNPPGSNGYTGSQFMNAYFTVTPNGGAAGFTYDITYNYSAVQRGTIVNEADIRLSKSDNSGTNWTAYTYQGTLPGQYQLNTTSKTITVYGLNAFSTFTNSDQNAPLPVELASFTSLVNGRDITLKWSTDKEFNNAGFDIERKASGTNQWSKVGYVQGKGVSNTRTNYTYDDKKLNSGKYNYRLKQIDNNGNYAYYQLSSEVNIELPKKYDLSQNYPNPFNPVTKIDYDLPFNSRVSIILYDMTGREVKTLVNETAGAGYYTLNFNASSISSGTYFYRLIAKSTVKDGQIIMTKKMVLVK